MFSQITSKFTTQYAFDFGLYLLHFMEQCIENKLISKMEFDEKYFQFLRDNICITYKLVITVQSMEQAAIKNQDKDEKTNNEFETNEAMLE